MAQENNFRMFSGDAKTLIFTVSDINSSAANITNHTVRWRVARDRYSSVLLTKSTTDGGITTTASTAGQFRVILNSTDTDGLKGVYYHEGELQSTASEKFTAVFGHVTFNPDLA